MSESASVEVLSAEVRVLKVWQRSDHTLDVLQLVGRDSKTAALVRYIAQPSNRSRQQGPSEFEHWLQHPRQSAPYPVAQGPDGTPPGLDRDADCLPRAVRLAISVRTDHQ